MNSLLLLAIFVLIAFSTVVTVDMHSKIQYTSYRDHRSTIWWASMAQILVLVLIGLTLLLRHVQFVNMEW